MKTLAIILLVSSLLGLTACQDSGQGPQPTKPGVLSFQDQQAVLQLSGLQTEEFISELAGLLSHSGLKSLSPKKLGQTLDHTFNLECRRTCEIQLKTNGESQ